MDYLWKFEKAKYSYNQCHMHKICLENKWKIKI